MRGEERGGVETEEEGSGWDRADCFLPLTHLDGLLQVHLVPPPQPLHQLLRHISIADHLVESNVFVLG